MYCSSFLKKDFNIVFPLLKHSGTPVPSFRQNSGRDLISEPHVYQKPFIFSAPPQGLKNASCSPRETLQSWKGGYGRAKLYLLFKPSQTANFVWEMGESPAISCINTVIMGRAPDFGQLMLSTRGPIIYPGYCGSSWLYASAHLPGNIKLGRAVQARCASWHVSWGCKTEEAACRSRQRKWIHDKQVKTSSVSRWGAFGK